VSQALLVQMFTFCAFLYIILVGIVDVLCKRISGVILFTNCDALFGSRVRLLVLDLLERPIKIDL